MTEKIGLDAIWNNDNFNKGQAEYINKLTASNSATGQASQAINQVGSSGQQAGNIFSALAGVLGMSTGTFLEQVGILAIAKQAWDTVTGAVGDFISYMFTASDSAVQVASRIEELNLAAQAMGQLVGMDGDQVNSLVKQLTSMEISQKDANQVVADFARYGLNMAQVIDLATVAENASILSGKSATETFTDMAQAIETMRIRSLKTNGIIFDASAAYQQMADSLGKDKDALTDTEQQQAFLNATIEKGANLAGLHAVAMQTAAEQMDRLKSKVLPDLANALGAPFQGAFYNIVRGISDLASTFTKLISEGGALYPLMINLGAVFEAITQPLLGLSDALTDFSDNKLGDFANKVIKFVSDAFDWGTDLVTNFATGMINAASTVLVDAINIISGILTYWIAPGSPPKMLPNIDEWGSEVMDEYLHGFTDADFSILNELQNPIEQALGSLADMGMITKQAASQLYVNLSEGLIKALDAGQLTDEMLNQLTQDGGIYGDELADLAKKEFELANSEKAVIDAEKALDDAKKRSAAAGAAVNQGLIEYNQMLRSGASKGDLKNKLDQINASKKAQTQAQKDIEAKQTALDLAKQQLIATQDQVNAIKEMIKVMIDLNKAQVVALTPPAEKEVTPKEKAGEAKAGGGVGVKTPTFDPSKITNAFQTAVDEAANNLIARFQVAWFWIKDQAIFAWADMLRNLKEAWDKSGLNKVWEGVVEAATGAWNWIKQQASDVIFILKRWWAEHGESVMFVLGKIGEFIGKVLAPIFNGFVGTLIFGWNLIKTVFLVVWQSIMTGFKVVLDILGGFFDIFADILKGDWGKALEDIKLTWTKVWNDIVQGAANIWKIITGFWETLKGYWNTLWDAISQKVTDIWNAIKGWIDTKTAEVKATIDTVTGNILTAWQTFWDDVNTKVTDIWSGIVTWVSDHITSIKNTLDTITGDIKTAWNTFWDDVNKKVTDIWNGIVTGINDKATAIKNAISDIFTDPNTGIFAKFTGWVSDMIQHGKDLIGGLVTGVTSAAQGLIDTVVKAIQDALDAAKDALGIAHSPSELFKIFGKELMEGLEIGITANMDMPRRGMQNAMVQTLAPAAVPITMGATNNYYQPNISMINHINNGMAVPALEAMITRTVRKGLKR